MFYKKMDDYLFCCGCLSINTPISFIYNDDYTYEILQECISIKTGDKFSICIKCKKLLFTFHAFKIQCIEIHSIIKNLKEASRNKDFIIDEIILDENELETEDMSSKKTFEELPNIEQNVEKSQGIDGKRTMGIVDKMDTKLVVKRLVDKIISKNNQFAITKNKGNNVTKKYRNIAISTLKNMLNNVSISKDNDRNTKSKVNILQNLSKNTASKTKGVSTSTAISDNNELENNEINCDISEQTVNYPLHLNGKDVHKKDINKENTLKTALNHTSVYTFNCDEVKIDEKTHNESKSSPLKKNLNTAFEILKTAPINESPLENVIEKINSEEDFLKNRTEKVTNNVEINRTDVKCYECFYCREMFSNKTLLKEHLPWHTEKKSFSCVYCQETFEGLGQISRHLNIVHSDIKPELICTKCSENHHTQDQMNFHTALDHALAKCPLCSNMFDNKSVLFVHLVSHGDRAKLFGIQFKRKAYRKHIVKGKKSMNNEKLKCQVCLRLIEKVTLEVHLKSHNRLPWCVCPGCDNRFYGIEKLSTHIDSSHKELKPSLTCSSCEKLFFVDEQLQNHEEKFHYSPDKKKTCKQCGIRFLTIRNLKRHTKSVHVTNVPSECHICHLVCKNKIKLRSHLNVHKNDHLRPKTICNFCGFTFQSIKAHIRNRHLKQEANRSIPCRFKCGKEFEVISELRKHYKIEHQGDFKYEEYKNQCNLCGKKFLDYQGLYSHHKFTHSELRPYKCTSCDKTFKKLCHLNAHTRSHTNERPFACDICKKRFRHAHTMQKHRMIHTGEKPHKCGDCGKRFTQAGTLKNHKRIHL